MALNISKFVKYLKVDNLSADDGFIAAVVDGKYKYPDGQTITMSQEDAISTFGSSYRLTDGTDFSITLHSSDDYDGFMHIYIDINGVNKGPNEMRKDLIILPYIGKTNKIFFPEEWLSDENWVSVYNLLYK